MKKNNKGNEIDLSQWSICFDWDGTLVPTTMVGMERIRRICRRAGLSVPEKEDRRPLWGLDFDLLIKTLQIKLKWTEDSVKQFWAEYYKDGDLKCGTFPGLSDALFYLHSMGANLSIISSRDIESLTDMAQSCGIDLSLFEYIQGGKCYRFLKPNQRVFDVLVKITKKNKLSLEKIIYVGDISDIDFLAARSRGLKFCGISSSFISTREDFERDGLDCRLIFDDPVQFIKNIDSVIKRINLISV